MAEMDKGGKNVQSSGYKKFWEYSHHNNPS